MIRIHPLTLTLLVLTLLLSAAAFAAAPAAQQSVDMGGVFGGNGQIEADSIEMQTNKEGKLDMMIAKRKVVLVSDKMNVLCDLFTYYAGRDRVVATGHPVDIKQEGVKATCENFDYSPSTGKATLKGNPKVWQKTPDGKWYGLSGEVVKINRLPNGSQSVIIEPGKTRPSIQFRDSSGGSSKSNAAAQGVKPASIEMATDEPVKEKKSAVPVGEPVSIDSGKTDKIPEPSIGGE